MTQPTKLDDLPDGFHALTQPQRNQLRYVANKEGVEFDLSLDPCFLTDKEEQKVIPCRKCKRVCFCNRFASAGKTECTNCREGSHSAEKVREFDRSKSTHTLTDKDDTKEVPCRNCGRPCIVNQFAAPAKVACEDCRESVPAPRRTVSIEQGKDGRYQEVVQVANPGDIQWTRWIIECPFDIERQFTEEEKAEHDQCRQTRLEAIQAGRKAQHQLREAEGALRDHPTKPKTKEGREKLAAAEAEVTRLDALVVSEKDKAEVALARHDELARIAFIRGAIAARYELLTDADEISKHALRRGERTAHLPDDYLDPEGYNIALKKEAEANV